ncbi:tetratricopeptide repeat-containing sensor histidine kinase [Marinoscillum pacificum]|uniref:tetratricopeptide repeat-containing sensor histidine kinase n=1 Tax=Marinoscillum pacificum TaxID=392723 RepID=UPI00215889E8|nr:sensor histidine kinase [Marinoscillum pacificum]
MRLGGPLFLAFILLSGSILAQQKIDSLLAVSDDSVGIELAQEAYEKALALSIETKDYSRSGLAEKKLGELFDKHSQKDNASTHFFKALAYFQQVENTLEIGRVYQQISNNYYLKGKNDSATTYILKSLDIVKKYGTKLDIMKSLNTKANIYTSVQQYTKAIEFYEEALAVSPEDEFHAVIFANMAMSYAYLREYDLALKCVDLGLQACVDSDDESTKYLLLSRKTMVFQRAEQLDSAEMYGLIVLAYSEENDPKIDLMVNYNQMGLIYVKQEKYALAQQYYEKSLKVAEELKFDRIHYIVANISYVAKGRGDYEDAYNYLYRHLEMRDSLDQLEEDENFKDLLVKYEAAEREQQIIKLKNEKLIQQVIVIIAVVVLIALLILLIVYRQKMKATKLVVEQSKELNKVKTRELKQENELKQIKARIEGQEKERLRIAKELHDSIAGNLAGIKLGLSRISENYSDDQAIAQIKSNIDQTYNEVRSISTNLSPLKTSDFTFLEMVKRYVEGMSHLHGFELVFDDNTTSDLLSLTDELKLELYRVFQELINNIVKHSNATLVEISINELEDQLNVIIEDDGCGFDESQITEGMGLKNIASRVAILKGEFHIDSKPGRGTITNIDIPFLENNMRYA